MTFLGTILFFITNLLVFIINPIVTALRLKLKWRRIIVVLSVLNIFTLGLTGLAAQILMIINLKKENYFNYNDDNYFKSVRQSERSRYAVHLVLYVLEFIVLLLPVITIDRKTVDESMGTLSENYNLFAFADSAFGGKEFLYVFLGAILFGTIMNIIVRDPRKTMLFDGIVQVFCQTMVVGISQGTDKYGDINCGIGLFLFLLLTAAFMVEIFVFEVLSIYPESFNKKEIVSNE